MERELDWFKGVVLCLFVLVSGVVAAQEASGFVRQPVRRNLFLSKEPNSAVPEVFVAGRMVTTLRFATPCDPDQTRILGWEGRFEPVLCGGLSVVVVPLRELSPDERFLLLVTFMDGSSLPFTLTAGRDVVDGQVDVFPNPESPDATRAELMEKREAVRALRIENHRYRYEAASVDHALATLLANNQVALTPFRVEEKWRPGESDVPGIDAEVSILMPKGRAAKGRVAVVFQITNLAPEKPWKLQEARLMDAATLKKQSFALRASTASIAPGEMGRIAVIMDLPPLDSIKTGDMLVLELFRDGGLRQGFVELDLASLASRVRR
jgi:uncharacterized protein (TIGR02268 family)